MTEIWFQTCCFYIECRKNPQVFSLLDVRHYPWFLIYSITVFGLASPVEQTKYPSDHKVFSFQKYFLNILPYKCHAKTVLSCFSFLTTDVTDSFGGQLIRKCIWSLSVSMMSISKSELSAID